MASAPLVSLVIPLYNEEDNVRPLAATLAAALTEAALRWELLLVDNGSSDRTRASIDALAATDPRIRKVVVEVNEGYGHGILTGLRAAAGDYVGFMCGDLQVEAPDVARILSRSVVGGLDLVKATRSRREDGLKRRLYSRALNLLVPALFGVKGRDVNGTPKVMKRSLYQALGLESRRWFIDAEIMIKSAAMPGVRLEEVPVVFHRRHEGRSTVRCLSASREILGEMAAYRWSRLARFRVARGVEANASRVLPG